jgi:pilus assembly protein Flp/PilA
LVLYLYCKAHAAWVNRDQGASAVEYGLLIAAIAAIIVGVVFLIGKNVLAGFTRANDCLTTPTDPTC